MAEPVDVKQKKAPVVDWSVWAKTPGLEQFGPGSKVELISGGVINFVYRVRSDKDDKLTVVLKNSEPYVKEFTMQPLSPERARVEIWALRKMDSAVPGSVPTPYLHQPDQNYMVLEDLGSYKLLRELMTLGQFDTSLVRELACCIAKLHRATHRVVVDEASHREMIQFCTLKDMEFIRTTVVFDDPIHREHEDGQHAQDVEAFVGDQALYPNWLKLRSVSLENHDCLAHGDFHASSVMIQGSSIKIFDFEMAHMGPAGTDLGHMLCNFVKAYFDHKFYPLKEAAGYHEQLKRALCDIVDTYFQEAKEYLSDADFARTISETAGFTGARLIRRVWGYHEPEDGMNEPLTEQGCLRMGKRLMRDYEKILTTQDLKQYLVEQDK